MFSMQADWLESLSTELGMYQLGKVEHPSFKWYATVFFGWWCQTSTSSLVLNRYPLIALSPGAREATRKTSMLWRTWRKSVSGLLGQSTAISLNSPRQSFICITSSNMYWMRMSTSHLKSIWTVIRWLQSLNNATKFDHLFSGHFNPVNSFYVIQTNSIPCDLTS